MAKFANKKLLLASTAVIIAVSVIAFVATRSQPQGTPTPQTEQPLGEVFSADLSPAVVTELTLNAKAASGPVTQAYVDAHISKLLGLQDAWDLVNDTDFGEINPDQPLFILRGDEELTQNYSEKPIMLASVSKLAVNMALVRASERGEGLESKAVLDHSALIELFGRRAKRFTESNFYTLLLDTYPTLREIATQAAGTEDDVTLLTLREQFSQALPMDIRYEVPLREILFQALSLSSNTANDIAKAMVSQFGTTLEAELKTLVPNYFSSPIVISSLEHWLAPLPNVGPQLEHVQLIHELGQKLNQDELSDGEELLVAGLVNNTEDFYHDFTHSDLGKELISKGYRILEKTGYYPVVFWVKEFTEAPFEYPPHMVVNTIVSIVPPKGNAGDVISFGHYQLYAVKLPDTKSTIKINGIDVTVSDVLPEYLVKVSDLVKAAVNTRFRDQMHDAIEPLVAD